MYKTRVKIWIFLFILSIINLNNLISLDLSTTTYNAYVPINEKNLIERIGTYKKSGSKIKVIANMENADIIIKESSNETISGYKKHAEQFTSPIVMFVPNKAYTERNTGFIHQTYATSFSNYIYIQKDLAIILEAIEENKKYSDIGIKEKIFGDTNVRLAIPNKNADGYNEVILLLKLTLNNYNYDNLNSPELNRRLDAIISKSVEYEDATEYFDKIYSNKKEERTIILAPEYVTAKDRRLDGTGDYNYYIECIPLKTINISYDLFLKETNEEDYSKLLKSLKKEAFFQKTRLRNKEIDFNITNTNHAPNLIEIIQK